MKLGTNQKILDKAKVVRRERISRRLGYTVIGVLLVIFLIVQLLRFPSLQISEITITGTKYISAADVARVADEALQGYYLGVIPKRSFVIYSRQAIIAALSRNFLRIASFQFTELSPRAIQIAVIEREPVAVWCLGKFVSVGERECIYMDETGMLYDKAPRFSGAVYFEVYSTGRDGPSLGTKLLTRAELDLVHSFTKLLTDIQVEPVALTLLDNHTYSITTAAGWDIIFNDTEDSATLGEHLKTVLQSKRFTEQLARKRNALAYIDVRFGNKVFYKFVVSDQATTSPKFSYE